MKIVSTSAKRVDPDDMLMKKNSIFQLQKYSRIRVCAMAHNLKYVEGRPQGLPISEMLYWLEENNDFAEFKVYLIHSRQVPLLHNTVMIIEMKELDWWPCVNYNKNK